ASRAQSFDQIAGFSPTWSMTATGGGDAEVVPAAWITDGLFAVLGAAPEIGRDFTPEDHRPGAPRVALVSRALWDRRFGGGRLDTQTITLDGSTFAIVGIMPRATILPNTQAEVWVPFAYNPFAARRDVTVVYAVARPKSTAGPASIDAE